MNENEQRVYIKTLELSEEKEKREIIKYLLVLKILQKNRKRLRKINIFTNFNLENSEHCDVFIDDMQKNEVTTIDIIKTNQQEGIKKEFYKNFHLLLVKEIRNIFIKEDTISNDIREMGRELERILENDMSDM